MGRIALVTELIEARDFKDQPPRRPEIDPVEAGKRACLYQIRPVKHFDPERAQTLSRRVHILDFKA
jgi:hypothetical protein